METSLFTNLIRLFKAVPFENLNQNGIKTFSQDQAKIALDLLKSGIVFDEKIYASENPDYLPRMAHEAKDVYGFNATKINSTLWNSFESIDNQTDLALRVWQTIHYLSTYGQGIVGQEGTSIEPEMARQVDAKVAQELTYITAIDMDELTTKVSNMVTSGVALKEEDIEALLDIIDTFKLKLDISKVKNKELMCELYEDTGTVPSSMKELTRLLLYVFTGSTLLIQSKEKLDELHDKVIESRSMLTPNEKYERADKLIKEFIKKYGIQKFANHFREYKKIYLIIRSVSDKETRKLINKAKRLSDKAHIKATKAPLDDILNPDLTDKQIENAAKDVTPFKLIKVYNYLNMAKNGKDKSTRLFRIRNGKNYFRAYGLFDLKRHFTSWLTNPDEINRRQLLIVKALRDKLGNWRNECFYIPENVDYTVPTSAKAMVGTVPYLTSFNSDANEIRAGVAWEKECDLDLHAIDINGHTIGWNSDFRGNGVTFSGDMTHTNQFGYAAEFDRIQNPRNPIILEVYNYQDGENTDIDVFVTSKKVSTTVPTNIVDTLGKDSFMFKDKMDENKKVLMVVVPNSYIKNKDVPGYQVIMTNFNFASLRVPDNINREEALTYEIMGEQENAIKFKDLVAILGGNVFTDYDEFNKQKSFWHRSNDSASEIDPDIKSLLKKTTSLDWATNEEELNFTDLSPAKVTMSTFIDLLKERED